MDKEQLYEIITRGNSLELESLLKSGRINADTPLPSGDSMITVAAGMGDARLEITKILIRYGANMDTPVGGMTLLKWIKQPTYCDNEATITYLTSIGASEKDISANESPCNKMPDLNIKPELMLKEGNLFLDFPAGYENNYRNHKKLIKELIEEKVYPDVKVEYLKSEISDKEFKAIIFISGSMDEAKKIDKVFYHPKAEELFARLFPGKDWNVISPPTSVGNIPVPGWSISPKVYETMNNYIKQFKDGIYKIDDDKIEREPEESHISPEPLTESVFRESFAIVIAEGYTSNAKKPAELFELIQRGSENISPPFETEMIVANGPGIAGDVLICYFENSFDRVPGNMGSFDFHTEFEQKWLNKIVPVKSPDYIIEYYGPRNYQLQKYWPGINILLNKRLLAGSKELINNNMEDKQAIQQTDPISVETPPEKENESSRKELSTDTIQEISGYPLAFRLNSLELKQSHKYGSDTSESELKVTPSYRIVVASITIQNKTEFFMRFSSEQFALTDKSGKKINAYLYGAGNSIAETGKIMSTETKVTGPDEKPIVISKGRLHEDVSFLEWILAPEKEYNDTLVYVIPVGESDLNLQFSYNNEPVRYTGESPLKIAFTSLAIQQSYQYKSGSSQMETTASDDYRFLLAKVNMTNNAEFAIRFSSENFSLMDNSNKKVDASFYGAGNHIAQSGKITSFETNIDNPDKKEKAIITGRLNPSVSVIEWELGPYYSREETLVFLIPAKAGNVKLNFDYCLGDGTHYKNTSSGSPGCFIATAAFSETSPEVDQLRAYRDNILNQNFTGRILISAYYMISPSFARWIRKSLYRKQVVRSLLQPILKISGYALKRRKREKSIAN